VNSSLLANFVQEGEKMADSKLDAIIEKIEIENVAKYIIETGARETTSGNYIFYPEYIPVNIISVDNYKRNTERIVDILHMY